MACSWFRGLGRTGPADGLIWIDFETLARELPRRKRAEWGAGALPQEPRLDVPFTMPARTPTDTSPIATMTSAPVEAWAKRSSDASW